MKMQVHIYLSGDSKIQVLLQGQAQGAATFGDLDTFVRFIEGMRKRGNIHAPTVRIHKDQRIAADNIVWEPEKEAMTPYLAEWNALLDAVRQKLPWLPVVTGRVVESGEVSERFLWDLRQTALELICENYAGHLRALAHLRAGGSSGALNLGTGVGHSVKDVVAAVVPLDAAAFDRHTRAVLLVVRHQAVIFPVHQRRRDHEVGGRPVAGNRDVPDHRHAQQRLHIRIVRLRFQWIPEEDQKINLVGDDLGSDLLIAAQGTALQADYRGFQSLGQ